MRERLPSPAMIVALIALAVALGGTTYAAVKLKKNSVKTKNIKAKAVKEPKLGDKAVSTRTIGDKQVKHGKLGESAVEADKIKDGAVTPAKLSDPTLTVRGWANVRGSDGKVLDGRNVSVLRVPMGRYCIDTTFPLDGAWVTPVNGSSTDGHTVQTPASGGCSAPYTDAQLDFFVPAGGALQDRDFYFFAN